MRNKLPGKTHQEMNSLTKILVLARKVLDFARKAVVDFVYWYLKPYRLTRKLLYAILKMAESSVEFELPRTFRSQHPVLDWGFGCLIVIPVTMFILAITGLIALFVMLFAIFWPLLLALASRWILKTVPFI
jgi:hypothetical protein